MKKIKRIMMLGLVLCLSAMALAVPAAAANADDEAQIIRYEDGSYLKITVIEDTPDDGATAFTTQSTTSGSKIFDYYNGSDEKLWTFVLQGIFTYDGVTAKATQARYGYSIYDSSWSFVSCDYGVSGASANARAAFKCKSLISITIPVVVSLTCTPNGFLG